MRAKTWEEWDKRNGEKPVYEWEPFPKDGIPVVYYPNGVVVTTKEFLKELLEGKE